MFLKGHSSGNLGKSRSFFTARALSLKTTSHLLQQVQGYLRELSICLKWPAIPVHSRAEFPLLLRLVLLNKSMYKYYILPWRICGKTLRERVILHSKPSDQPANSDKREARSDGVDLFLHPLPIKDKTETIGILNTYTIIIQFTTTK